MDQYQPIKTFLVYGDSGSGKSSFIKACGGRSSDNTLPETGGNGDSVTQDSGKIYTVDDEILGKLQLIDTRGTWDPSTSDNNQILDNLVKCLIDFSVGSMEGSQSQPHQHLDGVIYIHSSMQYARYSRDQRIAHLSSLVGSNLLSSTLTIMTHHNSLKEQEMVKFQLMVQNKHHILQDGHNVKASEYMYWDSEEPVENQKQQLKEILTSTLKSFDLTNITHGNERIIEKAKQLRIEDQVEKEVPKFDIVCVEKIVYSTDLHEYYEEKVLTVDRPESFINSLFSLTSITQNIGSYLNNTEKTECIRINPIFPPKALNPKLLVSCQQFGQTNLRNAVFTQDPIIDNRGDYANCIFKYAWKPTVDNVQSGRIDLKLKVVTQYKRQEIIKSEYVEKTKIMEMQPRYDDEKPYLILAKEECMEAIYQDIRKVTQAQVLL